MFEEPNEMYSQADFDQDAHIAAFLQASAVYLGVSADQVLTELNTAWRPIPAVYVLQAQHA